MFRKQLHPYTDRQLSTRWLLVFLNLTSWREVPGLWAPCLCSFTLLLSPLLQIWKWSTCILSQNKFSVRPATCYPEYNNAHTFSGVMADYSMYCSINKPTIAYYGPRDYFVWIPQTLRVQYRNISCWQEVKLSWFLGCVGSACIRRIKIECINLIKTKFYNIYKEDWGKISNVINIPLTKSSPSLRSIDVFSVKLQLKLCPVFIFCCKNEKHRRPDVMMMRYLRDFPYRQHCIVHTTQQFFKSTPWNGKISSSNKCVGWTGRCSNYTSFKVSSPKTNKKLYDVGGFYWYANE